MDMGKSYTYNFGKVDYNGGGHRVNAVEVEVNLRENKDGLPVFSASAWVWNGQKTDIIMGGQCLDRIKNSFSEIAENQSFQAIYEMWEKHHLNDLNAGTARQEAALDKAFRNADISVSVTRDTYKDMCACLEKLNLLYDDEYLVEDGKGNKTPYKYGTGWIYRAIPEKDLQRIEAMVDGKIEEYLNEIEDEREEDERE